MNDSIGGAWLFYIFIIFLYVLIALLSITVSYLDAYRTGQDIVECYENYDYKGSSDDPTCVNDIVTARHYVKSVTSSCKKSEWGDGIQYDVTTTYNISFILASIDVPLNHSTRTIYGATCPGSSS